MPATDSTFSSWDKTALPLEGESLTDNITFGHDGAVSFHWSDFRDACRLWQTRIAIEPNLRKDYEKRLQAMEKLRALPLWIRSGKTTTQTNLYDIYEGFIRDQLWQGDAVFPQPIYEISLISPSGPFKQMAVTNCFNLQTYRDFVMVFLLQDKLPRRDFRLRVKSKLLIEHGQDFSEVSLIELEQVTSTSILVKLRGDNYFGKIVPHQSARLLFKTTFLDSATAAKTPSDFRHEVGEWSSNPFYTHSKIESFTFDCKDITSSARFDGDATRDCFLRIGFDVIKASNAPLAHRLQQFIKVGQKSVLEMLEKKHNAA